MIHTAPATALEVWWFYAETTLYLVAAWGTYYLAASLADRPKKEDRAG